jgi:hypothetical protein
MVDNSNSLLNLLRRFVFYVLSKARAHKVKTIVILLGLYAAKKTYGIYNTLSDSFKSITGGDKTEQVRPDNKSELALTTYLSLNQNHFLQIEIFKKT